MKKFMYYFFPTFILILFIAVMLSGNYFKKPKNASEDVIGFVKSAITNVNCENWDKAEEDIENLDNAWKKVSPRIQFSVERDEIYNIGLNISRLKGAIMARDKSATLIELYEILQNWNELTK